MSSLIPMNEHVELYHHSPTQPRDMHTDHITFACLQKHKKFLESQTFCFRILVTQA